MLDDPTFPAAPIRFPSGDPRRPEVVDEWVRYSRMRRRSLTAEAMAVRGMGWVRLVTLPSPGEPRARRASVRRRSGVLPNVLDHLTEPWLTTEAEKVSALTAAGTPEQALPRRVY